MSSQSAFELLGGVTLEQARTLVDAMNERIVGIVVAPSDQREVQVLFGLSIRRSARRFVNRRVVRSALYNSARLSVKMGRQCRSPLLPSCSLVLPFAVWRLVHGWVLW